MRYLLPFLVAILFTGCVSDRNLHPEDVMNLTEKGYFQSKESNESEILDRENAKYLPPDRKGGIERVPSFDKSAKQMQNLMRRSKIIKALHKAKNYQVSVENIPINKFINLVFGEILGVDFNIEPNVMKRKDKVTLKMSKPVDREQFKKIITSVLQNYNIGIEEKDGVYYIKQKGGRKVGEFDIYIGKAIPSNVPDEREIIQLIPLDYVKAKDLQNMVQYEFLSPDAKIRVIDKFTLSIKDKAKYIRKVLEFADVIDKPSLKNKEAYLLFLKNIDPKDFKLKVEDLLKASGIPVMDRENFNMIPISEINALFVVSAKRAWIDYLLYWKDKLDTITQLGEEPKMFVYHAKNRPAKEIVNILNSMAGIQKEVSNKPLIGKEAKKGKETKKTQKKASLSVNSSDYKVTLDAERNALIITTTPVKYKEILSILKEIDTIPKQVLIEVMIADITLTDDLNYGVEWYIQDKVGDMKVKPLSGTDSSAGTLGGLGLGSSGFLGVINGAKFNVVLNAFKKNKKINILSTPRIIALNNEPATITVGQQIPMTNSEYNYLNGGNNQNVIKTNVTYQKTGISLNVTPTIISNGVLLLKISQDISDASKNSITKADAPIILNRTINTSVVLKSGQIALLGGLVRESKSKTDTKVPILGDIPIIGNLFKTVSNGSDKTELILTIRPYILDNFNKVDKVTKGFKEILKRL